MATAPGTVSGVMERAIDVLVVEDDADSALLLETLLATNGCIVRLVSTAAAALEAAAERPPDVVVTDIRLVASLSGSTLAWVLRRQPSTMHIGLIAVSGEPELQGRAAPPVDAFIKKPITELDALMKLVSELAARSRAGVLARETPPSNETASS